MEPAVSFLEGTSHFNGMPSRVDPSTLTLVGARYPESVSTHPRLELASIPSQKLSPRSPRQAYREIERGGLKR
jgi:hypothetical protein